MTSSHSHSQDDSERKSTPEKDQTDKGDPSFEAAGFPSSRIVSVPSARTVPADILDEETRDVIRDQQTPIEISIEDQHKLREQIEKASADQCKISENSKFRQTVEAGNHRSSIVAQRESAITIEGRGMAPGMVYRLTEFIERSFPHEICKGLEGTPEGDFAKEVFESIVAKTAE